MRVTDPGKSESALSKAGLAGRLFVGVPEFAKLAGIDARTVRRGIAAGDIPATHVGSVVRIPMSWIQSQMDTGETP
jgi:excisionase family DNA binding protein